MTVKIYLKMKSKKTEIKSENPKSIYRVKSCIISTKNIY